LFSVLAHDRRGRLKANADGAALVDEGTFGGNAPDDILRELVSLPSRQLPWDAAATALKPFIDGGRAALLA
jgi:hypothetical protein